MRNILYRLRHLNTWSSICGAVGKGYGSFRMQNLAGGSMSVGQGFESLWPPATSSVLVPSWVMPCSQLPDLAACCQAFPYHHGLPLWNHMTTLGPNRIREARLKYTSPSPALPVRTLCHRPKPHTWRVWDRRWQLCLPGPPTHLSLTRSPESDGDQTSVTGLLTCHTLEQEPMVQETVPWSHFIPPHQTDELIKTHHYPLPAAGSPSVQLCNICLPWEGLCKMNEACCRPSWEEGALCCPLSWPRNQERLPTVRTECPSACPAPQDLFCMVWIIHPVFAITILVGFETQIAF